MLLLLLSDLLSTWGHSQILALFNFHLLALGHELTAIGNLNASTLISSLICSLPAGILADWLGYRSTLIVAALIQASAITLQLTAPSTSQLVSAGALLGVALALFTAAKVPQISLLAAKRNLPETLALFRGLTSAGGVLGGITAAWISHLTGKISWAILVGALLLYLATLPLLLLPKIPSPRFGVYSFPLLRPGPRNGLLGSFFCCTLGASLISPYLNLLLHNRGLPLPLIGISFSAWQVAAVIAWPLTATLRRMRHPLLFALAGLSLLGYLASQPQAQLSWWLILFAWQLYLCLSLNFYYGQFASQVGAGGMRFAYLGLLYTSGSIIGTHWGGILLQQSAQLLLLVSAGCMNLAFILAAIRRANYKWS